MKQDRPKKRINALTAFSVRLGILLLAVWLVCMSCITLVTAQFILEQLNTKGDELSETIYNMGWFKWLYSAGYSQDGVRRQIPGVQVQSMNEAIAQCRPYLRAPNTEFYPEPALPEWSNVLQGSSWCEIAVQFRAPNGDVLRQSGDFLYFSYVTKEDWLAGSDVPRAYGWVDLAGELDGKYSFLNTLYEQDHALWNLTALRLTGLFVESRFEPLSMEILHREAYQDALDAAYSQDGNQQYTLSQLDAMGLLPWEKVFDETSSAHQKLVTIYALDADMSLYTPGGAVTDHEGRTYDTLLQWLQTVSVQGEEEWSKFYSRESKFDLWDTVIFSLESVRDLTQYNCNSDDPLPDVEFTIYTALRASPLCIAMGFLKRVYILTGALTLLGFWMIRRSVRKQLIEPLQAVNKAVEDGWQPISRSGKWAEPQIFLEHYTATRDVMRSNQNEISRLSTALEYARKAEEHRRQMTSNIAHELKTPLAVIHSYAEGLKEHVAEEKREKYLDVILSETERTDAMVLEMLDLSRLEAGKVKLARDDFSLVALTQSIFDKLELAVQERQLRLEFHFPADFTMTADEGRMAQVIENFATNAIKYTPVGGRVKVTIQTHRGHVWFYMENESEPLSQTALNKVWDTFYRTDESRSGGGTGLGLAIAKSIIELHGGKCFVRNTAMGVEFGFTI